MSAVVCTIGYERRSIDEFVRLLKDNGIEVLVDVRERPISRKPGFSIRSLSMVLRENDIEYVHFSEAGSPMWLRRKLRETRDYASFFMGYYAWIQGQIEVVQEICDLVATKTCCLMCFEREPKECHRSVLLEFVLRHSGTNVEVRHIV